MSVFERLLSSAASNAFQKFLYAVFPPFVALYSFRRLHRGKNFLNGCSHSAAFSIVCSHICHSAICSPVPSWWVFFLFFVFLSSNLWFFSKGSKMLIGFSGSRLLSQKSPSVQVACFVLSRLSALPCSLLAGASFAVGCCPSGLDSAVCAWCSALSLPFQLFKSSSKSAADLRSRTCQMVAAVGCLFAFPFSASVPHSGTWLSVFEAASRGIPCLVFLPGASAASLPLCRGVSSWRSVKFLGFNFWQPVLSQLKLEF